MCCTHGDEEVREQCQTSRLGSTLLTDARMNGVRLEARCPGCSPEAGCMARFLCEGVDVNQQPFPCADGNFTPI